MKVTKVDVFVLFGMFFFWFALYPSFNAKNIFDSLFYFGIPFSGFLSIMYLKIKEHNKKDKEEKTNAIFE